MTDEPRQKKQIKSKEWFKNLTEEKRKDGINIFLKGDEPKPKKKKGKKPKLTPEERKERRIERNRQYQLKNKELLKGKRQEKRKEIIPKRISLKSLTPEERREREREKLSKERYISTTTTKNTIYTRRTKREKERVL